MAARKTTSLPTNPAVGGIPARDRKKMMYVKAANGAVRPRPAKSAMRSLRKPRCVSRITMLKVPMVANKYTNM